MKNLLFFLLAFMTPTWFFAQDANGLITTLEEEAIYKEVDITPLFPGCPDTLMNPKERQKCSDQLLLDFIYSQIKYPLWAELRNVEGMVIIQFVVEKDGMISHIRIAKDIGAGCGKEAAHVVKSMPKWEPGRKEGQPVRVQFNLPVIFKIE